MLRLESANKWKIKTEETKLVVKVSNKSIDSLANR